MKKLLVALCLLFCTSCIFSLTVEELQKEIETFLEKGSYVKIQNNITDKNNVFYVNKTTIMSMSVYYYEEKGFGLKIDTQNFTAKFFDISLDSNGNMNIVRIKEPAK